MTSLLRTPTHPFLSNMRTGVKLELQKRESPLYLKEVRINQVSKNFSAHIIYNWTYSVLNFHVLFTWPSHTWTSSVGPLHMDQKHQTRSGMIPGSWQHRMKLQFFFKASKAYYVLSEAATNLLKYGRALRYIKLSLQCHGKDSLVCKSK